MQALTKHSTPGKDLEKRLNHEYGPGNPYYEDFCKYIKQGFEEGWVATGDLDNGKYRRGRVRSVLAFEVLLVSDTSSSDTTSGRR